MRWVSIWASHWLVIPSVSALSLSHLAGRTPFVWKALQVFPRPYPSIGSPAWLQEVATSGSISPTARSLSKSHLLGPPPTLSQEKVIIIIFLRQFTQGLNGWQRLNDLLLFHILSWKEKYKWCHNLVGEPSHRLFVATVTGETESTRV